MIKKKQLQETLALPSHGKLRNYLRNYCSAISTILKVTLYLLKACLEASIRCISLVTSLKMELLLLFFKMSPKRREAVLIFTKHPIHLISHDERERRYH